MSDQLEITNLSISGGLCVGQVTGAGAHAPTLRFDAGEVVMPAPQMIQDGASWRFEQPLPAKLLDEGARAVLILDAASGRELAQFALSVGEALADDLRAEVAQLRAELDLLKTAFRREMQQRDV